MIIKLFLLCLILMIFPTFSNAQFIGIGINIPGMSCTGTGGGIPVINNQLIFNGIPVIFNGSNLTFNH